jgi:hypothetical protein
LVGHGPVIGGAWTGQGYLEWRAVPGYGFGLVLAMDRDLLLLPVFGDDGPGTAFAYRRDGLNWVPNGSMMGDYDVYQPPPHHRRTRRWQAFSA